MLRASHSTRLSAPIENEEGAEKRTQRSAPLGAASCSRTLAPAPQLIRRVQQTLRALKNWSAVAAFLLIAVCASAGIIAPELVPNDRAFLAYGDLRGYHVAVRDALLGANLRSCCEALVLPSFEREWSVHLGPRTAGGVQVVYSVMEKSLWGEMETAAQAADGTITPESEHAALARLPKDVQRFTAHLPTPVADQLERVWAVMLARATQPTDRRFGLDGTAYHLFRWNREGRYEAGSTWSPHDGTNAAQLVGIIEELRKYADPSGSARARSESALADRASRLLSTVQDSGAVPQ